MESRWVLLGFGLLFRILLLVNIQQGNVVRGFVAVVFTIFGLGEFWWNTTQDDPIETIFSRSQ